MWASLKKKTDIIFGRFPGPPFFYTFLSLVFGLLGYFVHPTLFILAGLCDVIDGAVARVRRQSSALGAFSDGLIDRFVDLLLVLRLPVTCIAKMLLLFFGFMPSYITAYAHHRGLKAAYTGLLGRPVRFVLLLALFVVPSAWPYALAGLILITLIRLWANLREPLGF